jgi:hypothetical protein
LEAGIAIWNIQGDGVRSGCRIRNGYCTAQTARATCASVARRTAPSLHTQARFSGRIDRVEKESTRPKPLALQSRYETATSALDELAFDRTAVALWTSAINGVWLIAGIDKTAAQELAIRAVKVLVKCWHWGWCSVSLRHNLIWSGDQITDVGSG